ncbi:MAG: M12 family metallo-peptidase, partial [Phycisphaerae bacterium]
MMRSWWVGSVLVAAFLTSLCGVSASGDTVEPVAPDRTSPATTTTTGSVRAVEAERAASDSTATVRPIRLVSSTPDLNVVTWDRPVMKQAARQQRALTVEGFPLLSGETVDLDIEPFRVTSPDTRFVIRRKGQPDVPFEFDPSSVLLFRGSVKDRPGSHVFLSLRDKGSAGYIDLGMGASRHLISSRGQNGQQLGSGKLSIFQGSETMDLPPGVPLCGTEGEGLRRLEAAIAGRTASMAPKSGATSSASPSTVGIVHHELAVETDYEYFALFGDVTEATAYLIQMYGAVSDIYMRDVRTHIEVVFTGIWTDPNDEYNGPDPLGEFYTYWEINMGGVQRDAAQLFSGRRNYPFGGQAFVAQLCNFAYGVVGYAVGFFPDPSKPHPFNYDVSVTAHELGHNFAAPHTHSKNPAIDDCGNIAGDPQRGTIMSYCSQTWSGMNANMENYFHTRIRDEDMIPHINDSSSCMPLDCNLNNVADAIDIGGGASDDGNGNSIPDECEDCNNNGVLDPADIAGASDDDNGNGIPDECEPDCNNNGSPDDRDIALGTSDDAYGNGIPDECEEDCNNNGTSDYTEIQLNMPLDVDRDAVLDSCQNCDADGLTDHQELEGAHYAWVASGISGAPAVQFFPTTGVVTSLTQTGGSATIFEGQDVVISPAGQVLISSAISDRILEYNPNGSFQRVLVNTGAGGLDYPTGMAISPAGTLLVASRDTDAVLEFDVSNGDALGMFVPAGSGGLDAPYGLTFDRNGNLYVASSTNEILRYNGATGASMGKLVAASNNGGMDQPRGMTFKADGNLLVASYGTDEVLEFEWGTGEPLGKWAQVGTSDRLTQDSPWGIRVAPNGHVFVTRTGTDYSSGGGGGNRDAGDVGYLHFTDARMYEYDVCTGLFRRTHIGGNDHGLDFATGFAIYPGWDIDCNNNQIQDDCDIASGFSEDANTNGTPDECEIDCNANGTQDERDLIPFGSSFDCNCNFIPDECDVSSGSSGDCNGNNVPDECEDCNGNGLADACDISGGGSDDCNANAIPDDCESATDCNNNGSADICDLFDGTASDCNENGIPDTCDAAGGGLILDVDFEGGLPAGWSTSGIFSVTTACTVNPVCDGIRWAYAGSTFSCSYGNNQSGELVSPPIALPAAQAELSFCQVVDTEAGFDFVEVFINSDQVLQEAGEVGVWEDRSIDLTPYGGQNITITFRFASDSFVSGTLGWQVDNIRIVAGSEDCNANSVPDECDPDCDGDTIPDACDGAGCTCPIATAPQPEATAVAKNRCLSIVPTNAGVNTALRVNLKNVPSPLSHLNGTKVWVSNPQDVTEASGDNDNTPPTFTAASLQSTPDCRDWGAVGPIDVIDTDIIPGGTYEVQAIDCICATTAIGNYSSPLQVDTSIWGDVVGNNFDLLVPGRWDPP